MDNNKKVLRELFNNPTYRFHVRGLARKTKLNPNTVSNIVNKLEKEKIVRKQRKKHIIEIELNMENDKTIWKKRLFNLGRLYESKIIKEIKKLFPSAIVVIGSYSRGEDIEKSDIDLVVLNSRGKIELKKFEKKLKRDIHLINVKKTEISEEFFNSLINGIVLYGAIRK